MITIIATVKVKEGKMDEVIKLLKEIVPKIRESESGCKAYIPHTIVGDKNKDNIIFYEKYENKAALNIHTALLPENFKKILPLLEGGMDVKTCIEIC